MYLTLGLPVAALEVVRTQVPGVVMHSAPPRVRELNAD